MLAFNYSSCAAVNLALALLNGGTDGVFCFWMRLSFNDLLVYILDRYAKCATIFLNVVNMFYFLPFIFILSY